MEMDIGLEKEKITIQKPIPVLPLKDAVAFPSILIPLTVTIPENIKLVDTVLNGDKLIGMFLQRGKKDTPTPEEIFNIGVAGKIVRMLRFPDQSLRILVQGLERIRIKDFVSTEPFYSVEVEILQDIVENDRELKALVNDTIKLYQELVSLSPYLPEDLSTIILNIEEPSRIADFIASNMKIETMERQRILETVDIKERLKMIISILSKELDVLKLGEELRNKIRGEMEKVQRDFLLREQLKAIKKELGEESEEETAIKELENRFKKTKMNDEASKVAREQLDRLKIIPPQAAEYTVVRTYLEWLLDLPWNVETKDNLDIKWAHKVLEEDHYNLKDVKERILEFLAVRKLKKDPKSPILCFVGPPGVGKTSLGQSIAHTLGRKFIRISLGGVHDEAEIRGHRRTYIGAMPGRIIQSLKRVNSKNPVFMMDEIDKIGMDFRGDPSSALLEVLDPEQNYSFVDHYIDVPFDLSHIMFITTANIIDTIPPALRDRMEIITIPGYTVEEKVIIAQNYLIPRQMRENGLKKNDIKMQKDVLIDIISGFTREAGVRNLEREIGKIFRKVAKMKGMGKKGPFLITKKNLSDYLGPVKIMKEKRLTKPNIGVATGLAWTPYGGEILFVETNKMKGKRNLILTGQLGEIMQESAQAGLSYIRANAKKFKIDPDFFEKYDIHIHIPEGSIPKDGPSAGITMFVSMFSILTEKPVLPNFAMTGETTLKGDVLPVGGIKEKVLAAKMANIKNVVLPEENRKDVEVIEDSLKKGMKFFFVSNVEEIIKLVIKD